MVSREHRQSHYRARSAAYPDTGVSVQAQSIDLVAELVMSAFECFQIPRWLPWGYPDMLGWLL